MGRRRRHHVVSQGYQRQFTQDKRIFLADRLTLHGKPVGTRDAFVRKHFNSYWTEGGRLDEIEDQWARTEDAVIPDVRRLISGEDRCPATRNAAKVLAAVHFGRSYSFDQTLQLVIDQYRDVAPAEMAADTEMLRLWRSEHGRDPLPGEIQALVLERMDDVFDSAHRVERMGNAHNVALEKLDPLRVQVIDAQPGSVHFITGDTPFVHFSNTRAGFRDRLALGDADHLYMALSPTVAVMFISSGEKDERVGSAPIREMNQLVRRASMSQVACHPRTHLRRAVSASW